MTLISPTPKTPKIKNWSYYALLGHTPSNPVVSMHIAAIWNVRLGARRKSKWHGRHLRQIQYLWKHLNQTAPMAYALKI